MFIFIFPLSSMFVSVIVKYFHYETSQTDGDSHVITWDFSVLRRRNINLLENG